MCHVSCVMCLVSCVTSHMSNVTCHVSSSKHLLDQPVKAWELKLWQKFYLPQSVICDMSCVIFILSHVTGCVSRLTCHVSCVIFKIPSLLNRQSWGVKNFTECPHSPNQSCAMCHESQVWCHESCVMSFVSYFIFLNLHGNDGDTWHMPG